MVIVVVVVVVLLAVVHVSVLVVVTGVTVVAVVVNSLAGPTRTLASSVRVGPARLSSEVLLLNC